MFRPAARFGLAMAMVMAAAMARADDLKSGLQVGDSVGSFTVLKVAGGNSDNVKLGDSVCYR